MNSVLCPGELLIDFISKDIDKNLIEANIFEKKAGGAPANAALAINKYGGKAYFAGSVGNDKFGEYLINTLKKNKLSTKLVKKINTHTTLAFVSIQKNANRSFNFARGADEYFKYSDIDKKILEECSIIHFSSATAFLGGELENTYFKLLEYAKKNNKIISFDPNYREQLHSNIKKEFIEKSIKFISNSDIVKLSDDEAILITNEKDINNCAKKILKLGAKNVLITLGNKGVLYGHDKEIDKIKTIKVKAIDTTGAGDAFIGSLIGQISNLKKNNLTHNYLIPIIENSTYAASISTTKSGAMESIPEKKEIEEYLKKTSRIIKP